MRIGCSFVYRPVLCGCRRGAERVIRVGGIEILVRVTAIHFDVAIGEFLGQGGLLACGGGPAVGLEADGQFRLVVDVKPRRGVTQIGGAAGFVTSMHVAVSLVNFDFCKITDRGLGVRQLGLVHRQPARQLRLQAQLVERRAGTHEQIAALQGHLARRGRLAARGDGVQQGGGIGAVPFDVDRFLPLGCLRAKEKRVDRRRIVPDFDQQVFVPRFRGGHITMADQAGVIVRLVEPCQRVLSHGNGASQGLAGIGRLGARGHKHARGGETRA